MEIPLLGDIVIILSLSIVILFICIRLKIPGIIGFLISGTLAGPYAFGIIKAVHEVEIMAEIGIILLMFTIGMEFSLKKLMSLGKPVLLGGSIQVFLTIIVFFIISLLAGLNPALALFAGFLVSLSSTAIVLKIIQARGEVDSPYGRISLAILIFQDIIIVPMMLFVPLLAGKTGNIIFAVALILIKAVLILILVAISAKWIIPALFFRVVQTKNKELFLLCIIVLCFGEAFLTSYAGLSLALGALLAGLIIAESGYNYQALSGIVPFRDLFTSFFFISIGMLLNINFLYSNLPLIILITVTVILVKALISGLTALILGYPLRPSILAGLALAQIGEFSFILAKSALSLEFLPENIYQIFLSVSVLTIAATPFIISLSLPVSNFITAIPLPAFFCRFTVRNTETEIEKAEGLKNHIIIVGFGLNGRNLAKACSLTGIPYVILEMNPDTVKEEKLKGEPVYYADATQEIVLKKVQIQFAKIIVVGINDPPANLRVTELAKRLNPSLHIIVRTRFMQEIDDIYKLGASEVVVEEFETSFEVFTRVLRKYLIPQDEIEKIVMSLRSGDYKVFRKSSHKFKNCFDLELLNISLITLRIKEKSLFSGKSLSQIDLRKKYKVTLAAIKRKDEIISSPDGEMVLNCNDLLILMGSPEDLAEISKLLK